MSDEVRDPKTNQLIYPGFQRGPGLHNASSYQVSAIPYLSGNLTAPPANGAIVGKITFPAVTSWFKIDNLSNDHELRFSFSETGLAKQASYGGNYNIVQSATGSWNTTGQLSYKVRSIYVKSNSNSLCDFQISAGLTHILHDLSASAGLNWSGSLGVG
jgi:hypothetical protein